MQKTQEPINQVANMATDNLGGRPPIELTDEQIENVEKLAAQLNVEQLADFLGIGRSTFYDIMDRDERVSGRYKRGRANAIGGVAKNLIQKAMSGDNAAMIFFLKTQAGWKEHQVVEQETKMEIKGRVTLDDFYGSDT